MMMMDLFAETRFDAKRLGYVKGVVQSDETFSRLYCPHGRSCHIRFLWTSLGGVAGLDFFFGWVC